MRHLKIYEDIIKKDKKYWLLPTDDRFEKSLYKINAPLKFLTNQGIEKDFFVFIGNDGREDTTFSWGWDPYDGKRLEWWFEENGFRFMGCVNMEDWKPELYMATKKYNL